MLIAWKYQERDTLVQRTDPRARMIFMLCVMFALYLLWDLRWVLPLAALSILQFALARISFRESRYFWFVIVMLALFLSILSALTGSRMTGYVTEIHPLYTGPSFRLLFWQVTPSLSVEQVVFLSTQILRILSFALLAIVIPFTVNPAHYGVMFRSLGIPDKIAYAMDLSFRLVPSTARDFNIILDAQRARAYEVDKLRGGVFEKVRRMAPLVVPLVIGAIINGEDIADAMDLRAFGIGPRTWLAKLSYRWWDRAVIAFSFLVLAVGWVGRLTFDAGLVWVPPFLLDLAGG